METTKPVVDFDLHSLEFRNHRVEVLDKLRAESPIAWTEAYGGHWVVTSYELICQIVRNTDRFRSERLPNGKGGILIAENPNKPVLYPGEVDGELHDQARRKLNPYFAKPVVATFEAYIEQVMDGVLDKLVGRKQFDAMVDLVNELPVKVALKYVGIDNDDPWGFYETCSAVVGQPTKEFAAEVTKQLLAYVDEKRDPERQSDDVISWLIQSGVEMTDDEWVGDIIGLVTGAVANTASVTAHVLSALDEDRALRARLIAEPEKIPTAVEEVMRTHAPNLGLARTCFVESEIGGQLIQQGDRILLVYSSGNVDDANFPNAKTIDIDRKRSPHLSFGRGVHFCVGSWLARLEIEVAIRKVLERMPNYSVDRSRADYVDDVGIHIAFATLPIYVNE